MAQFIKLLGADLADQRIEALGVMAYADALKREGFNHQAEEAHLQAQSLFLAANELVGWARACSGRLLAAIGGQDVREALVPIPEARQILVRHGHYFRAAVLDQNTALALRYQGDAHASEKILLQGLAILECSEHPSLHLKALLLGNLGTAYLYQGNFQKSLDYYEEARAILGSLHLVGDVAQI